MTNVAHKSAGDAAPKKIFAKKFTEMFSFVWEDEARSTFMTTWLINKARLKSNGHYFCKKFGSKSTPSYIFDNANDDYCRRKERMLKSTRVIFDDANDGFVAVRIDHI